MKTFVQPGRSITVAAPAGGVSSGDGVLIGNLFGIAQGDALATEDVEILTEGVAEIAKTSALAGEPVGLHDIAEETWLVKYGPIPLVIIKGRAKWKKC